MDNKCWCLFMVGNILLVFIDICRYMFLYLSFCFDFSVYLKVF